METIEELPPIDERLALPEAGYEIIDGVVTFVVSADPPHAEQHQRLARLLGACVHRDFKVALEMLTRTSKIDDIAADASVFSRAPHPQTGGRHLEQLAFEIASSTESMSLATTKARKLAGRGVRRVFAIDITRNRVVEWSSELDSWAVLELDQIEDPALDVPLSITALLDTVDLDDEVARVLIAKRNPVSAEIFEEARKSGYAQGLAEAVIERLAARGISVDDTRRDRILAERDLERLDVWISRAVTCAHVDELFEN